MWTTLVLVITSGLTLQYFLFFRDWIHWNKNVVLKVRPGPCEIVKDDGGSEDIVHTGDGIFFITTGFGFGKLTGGIIGLEVNGRPSILTVNITNVPDKEEHFLASPHGMTSWKDPATDRLYLYVITHPLDEDKIRVFEVLKPLQLDYIKTITDPSFTYMNNLVAVDLDKFYITKYTIYRDPTMVYLEHWSHLRQGKILYYDGRKAREVSSGYFMPNGINASPDKKFIYLAEWGGQRLHAFKRDISNNLVKVWDLDMGGGLDNINVDENGNLWVARHHILWKIAELFGSTAIAQVVRVKIQDNAVVDIEEIYTDDGQECSSSTVASYYNQKLIIGTLHKQTVVCDIKYLSK